MKSKKVKARVNLSGIKGRDKKIKGHGFDLYVFDLEDKEQVTQEQINDLIEIAKNRLKEFKNVSNVNLKLTNIEIDDGKNEKGELVGMESESFMMFSDKVINIIP